MYYFVASELPVAAASIHKLSLPKKGAWNIAWVDKEVVVVADVNSLS